MTPAIAILPSFHYDVAYLKSHQAYLPQCFEILDTALDLLAEHQTYHFLVEQVILLQAYWEARPERHAQLRDMAAAERLAIAPGMYVMPDMNHCDGESLFRQAELGFRWLEEHLDYRPTVCWIADCWGHHAQLPQILAACGYRTYVFWRCMRPELLRRFFCWRGIDGTQIHAHWLAKGYTNLHFGTASGITHALDQDFADAGEREIRALCKTLADFGDDDKLLLCNGGDFTMPQPAAPRIVDAINRQGDLRLDFTTPETFFGTIDWEQTPVVDGEFNSSLQGTFTSNIRIKQHNRVLVQRLLSIEMLAALSGKALPSQLDQAWPLLLKQQFHDIICGTICDEALADALREYEAAATLLDEAAASLAGDHWFNPTSFPRTERIDNDDAPTLVTVPPLGTACVMEGLPPAAETPLPATFETPWYCATIGADGYLSSLRLTGSDSELIDDQHPAAFGSIVMQMDYGDLWINFQSPLSGGSLASSLTQNDADPYDRGAPTDIVGRGTFRPRLTSVQATRRGDAELQITQRGVVSFWQLQIAFESRIRLSRWTPRIDYRTTIQPLGRHYRIRAAFPTTLRGTVLHEIPFGLQERGIGEHCAQHGFRLANDEQAMAVLNRGTPGASVDEGVLLLTLFRAAAMEYKAPSVASFSEGIPHTFDYAILPHAAADRARMVREGIAFNRPLLPAHPVDGCTLVGDANIQLTALRRLGSDYLLRLHEATGSKGAIQLAMRGCRRWAETNGLGEPITPWQPLDCTLQFAFTPFQVRSLRLAP